MTWSRSINADTSNTGGKFNLSKTLERPRAWTRSIAQLTLGMKHAFLQWVVTNQQNKLPRCLISVQTKIRCLSEIYVLAETEILGLMCHSGKPDMLTCRSLKTFVLSQFCFSFCDRTLGPVWNLHIQCITAQLSRTASEACLSCGPGPLDCFRGQIHPPLLLVSDSTVKYKTEKNLDCHQ